MEYNNLIIVILWHEIKAIQHQQNNDGQNEQNHVKPKNIED